VNRACRPTDFSYKHEAKHNSMLVSAQLWGDVEDRAIIDNLSRILIAAKSGETPEFFNYLIN
jgi:general transcription factor 3C protein 4